MSKFLQWALIAAGLVTTSSAHAVDYLPDTFAQSVGQHGFMNGSWWICRSYDDYQKAGHLLKEAGGMESATAAEKLLERDCMRVLNKTPLVVESTNWTHSILCVRPAGEPDCGWINFTHVTRLPCSTDWREGCTVVPKYVPWTANASPMPVNH